LAPGQAGFCVDDNAAKYMPLYPKPTSTPSATSPNIANFRFAGQQVINENFATVRLDHKLSDKDSLFGTYLYDNTPYNSPDPFDNILLESLTRRQFGVLEENHIFSSHNEREITTNNVFPGGMLMMMLVDSREFVIDESN